MPDRMIREGLKTSDAIAAVSEGAETLFVRLLLTVCPLGRFHADPVLVKAAAYPKRPHLRTSDVARRLDELEKAGLIVRYGAHDGKPLLTIPRFNQRLKFQANSPFSAPPAGPADAPGQALLWGEAPPGYSQTAPPPETPRLRAREEKRRENPPIAPRREAAGGEAPKPRRFRTAERRLAAVAKIDAEIAAIRQRMRDIYHPGGSAHRATPTPERQAEADRLRARWDALDRERDRLTTEETPENPRP